MIGRTNAEIPGSDNVTTVTLFSGNSGVTVTATGNGRTKTAISDSNGQAIFKHLELGYNWTFSAEGFSKTVYLGDLTVDITLGYVRLTYTGQPIEYSVNGQLIGTEYCTIQMDDQEMAVIATQSNVGTQYSFYNLINVKGEWYLSGGAGVRYSTASKYRTHTLLKVSELSTTSNIRFYSYYPIIDTDVQPLSIYANPIQASDIIDVLKSGEFGLETRSIGTVQVTINISNAYSWSGDFSESSSAFDAMNWPDDYVKLETVTLTRGSNTFVRTLDRYKFYFIGSGDKHYAFNPASGANPFAGFYVKGDNMTINLEWYED